MIASFLSGWSFTAPAILGVLAFLPALWFLMRITPPPPKTIMFPALRLLKNIGPTSPLNSQTPLWIMILRILIAAIAIIAMAGPVRNAQTVPDSSGNLRLIIDNSWAAAKNWDTIKAKAREALDEAAQNNRAVLLMATAPEAGTGKPLITPLSSAAKALDIVQAMQPLPWPSDYKAVRESTTAAPEGMQTLWLSHGIHEEGQKALSEALVRQGSVKVHLPADTALPLVLKSSKTDSGGQKFFPLEIDGAAAIVPPGLSLQMLSADGTVLDAEMVKPGTGKFPLPISPEPASDIRSMIGRFALANMPGAASVVLLDSGRGKRTVGVAGSSDTAGDKPFAEGKYYITRALESYSDLIVAPPEHLVRSEASMIVLPDTGNLPVPVLEKLESWISKGGVLVRFAGPEMMNSDSYSVLTPVRLSKTIRSAQGTLGAEEAPRLEPFPESSPFFGISLHEPIRVRQQVLGASGAQDNEDKKDAGQPAIWASFNDGTPLVSARNMGRGMIVLVHTTATPEWSDLALSGVFASMLERLAALSGRPQNNIMNMDGFLNPASVLDGFGKLVKPGPNVRPLAVDQAGEITPGPNNPPGIYEKGGFQIMLNLGDRLAPLKRAADFFPPGVDVLNYSAAESFALKPYLLLMAALLFLADWIIAQVMARGWPLHGGYFPRFRKRTIAVTTMAIMMIPAHSFAANDMTYANGLYLAYVQTGNAVTDGTSEAGLTSLANVLKARTAVEPAGVAAVNPETDILVFFPLIYWPVGADQKPLSDQARFNLQEYLDHGGTILFDTQDGGDPAEGAPALHGFRDNPLSLILGGLQIPALEPVPQGHVLGRSFYLLNDFPGAMQGGTLWVESGSAPGRDGVSSIIVGGNDWAGGWAGYSTASDMKGEMPMRFGVNLIMYALTGNYKADQVHIPYILERLGRE